MGSETMERLRIKSAKLHVKGFTLIASLLMLLVLSGLAIGLMMMVTTESKVGSTDLQNNVAFHAAEGGIEKMASDLNSVFQSAQSPTASQICAVSATANQPSVAGVAWTQYSVMPGTTQGTTCPTALTSSWAQVTAGPDQGLWAQVIPVNMLATAQTPGGQEVSMTRNAQVALIPVFQFGVFSESDLSFFSGPNFDVIGRVHTNADLYPFVGGGSTLTFHNKVEAFGNVVRTQLANGYAAATNYAGTVDIPTANNGCTTPTTSCAAMTSPSAGSLGDGSVTGAGSSTAQGSATYNTTPWNSFSRTTTNFFLINGNYGSATTVGTGAKDLKMPFVSGTTLPFQIIRRPTANDSQSLSQSREYNLAQIHVLLSDDPAELPTGSVRLANVTSAEATAQGGSATNPFGFPLSASSVPAALPALGGTTTYNLYFAAASNAFPDITACGSGNCPSSSLNSDWPYAPTAPTAGAVTLVPTTAPVMLGTSATATPTIALCPPVNVAAGSRPAGCPSGTSGAPPFPYYAVGGTTDVSSNATAVAAGTASWNLIDGYLYVEYKDATGNWHNATTEWLQLGFARGLTPPTQSGGGSPATATDMVPTPNPVNPNAILLLQEPADRAGNGSIDQVGAAPACSRTVGGVCTTWTTGRPPEVQPDTTTTSPWFGLSTATTQSVSMYNWYPINFYDVREGEVRDNTTGDGTCTTNGLLNAVEIDVGNLKRWLAGTIGTNGASVDYVAQNGYVLYFSDRRGMLPDPTAVPPSLANTKSGDSGLEDVVNAASAAGTPDGVLEPIPAGRALSPEDVNQDGVLEKFGAANLGLGQYNGTVNQNTQINLGSLVSPNPFLPRIASCTASGRKNWVSGARHVLRLVDGYFGNVPNSPAGTLADPGGFAVASENPVYVLGDYNTYPADTTWNSPAVDVLGHSSASVMADAVTFLSNNWNDLNSMGSTGNGQPTSLNNRTAATTYYRLAVAGGKNINFPQPGWGAAQDFGTDGGVHNFLRYLENWGGQSFNYKGSLVSLYYSTYNTGVFKCCTVVYSPPTRNVVFDLDFTNPQGLPPGTPLFRDVESLGYRQLFASRQTGQ